jgi:acetyltransferase-like isoleucine patch superfamily enzyme
MTLPGTWKHLTKTGSKVAFIRKVLFFFLTGINRLIFRMNKVKGPLPAVNGIITLVNRGGIIKFGSNGTINSSSVKNIIGGDTRSAVVVRENAVLEIGDNFKMSNSAIYCASRISIGNNVMLGGSCKIWDTDFHPLDAGERRKNPNENYKVKPIVIEDDVFIGGFSIVLKGVTIGKASVIGAGSVVTKDVPPGEIWAGNPARFIRKL